MLFKYVKKQLKNAANLSKIPFLRRVLSLLFPPWLSARRLVLPPIRAVAMHTARAFVADRRRSAHAIDDQNNGGRSQQENHVTRYLVIYLDQWVVSKASSAATYPSSSDAFRHGSCIYP